MGWINSLLKKYESFKPFTENEAWNLFRLAAIAEAVGWTLLISGILIGKYLTPGNNIAVQIAGHFHGTLFLIYIAAVLALYPSQGWTKKRTIIAGLASIPPYGSLLFEQWAAHQHQKVDFHRHIALFLYRKMAETLA